MAVACAGFTGAEMEFLAEEELVTVVPNMSFRDPLLCMGGTYGPFVPMRQCQVPLWLALLLKEKKKCSIRPPEWMQKGNLQEVLRAEQQEESKFEPMPLHYVEIGKLLLQHAPEDVNEFTEVQSLLEDIQEIRLAKIFSQLKKLSGPFAILELQNLSAFEINHIRPQVLGIVEKFVELSTSSTLTNSEDEEEDPLSIGNSFQEGDEGARRILRRGV